VALAAVFLAAAALGAPMGLAMLTPLRLSRATHQDPGSSSTRR